MKYDYKFNRLKCCIILVSIAISLSINVISPHAYNLNTMNYIDKKQYVEAEKVVFLTFDDGPSYEVTAKLLNILKEHDVKATFFVVGKEIKGKESILKRIHAEGHGIGLHTYTHNFKIIYKNHENFINEMKKTAYVIHNILGISPKAIRFPGGSAGLLNEEFLSELHKNKFKVYDWNVDLHDGVSASFSPAKLIKYSKKVKGNPNQRIILAHCNYNNRNTCKALGSIIEYYKENGFTFKVIDENTKEYYYKLKK